MVLWYTIRQDRQSRVEGSTSQGLKILARSARTDFRPKTSPGPPLQSSASLRFPAGEVKRKDREQAGGKGLCGWSSNARCEPGAAKVRNFDLGPERSDASASRTRTVTPRDVLLQFSGSP